jgi:hypothetical protein
MGENGVRIEFNPTRPRGRVRYSIAHEIAHTFFPDCANQVRNRERHQEGAGDTWQLEALCNIAAAELVMPIAALSLAPDERPAIESLLQERHRFDVSTEALFIRVARASAAPVAMFTASGVPNGRYRLDYIIPSSRWGHDAISGGTVLPSETLVAQCKSIGFTASGDERWGRGARSIHIECVGIPAYPGNGTSRVAGIVWDSAAADNPLPLIRYVRGDATAPRGHGRSLIVHVVNDASPTWGGSGFASALRQAYPPIAKSFRAWWMSTRSGRLGRVHIGEASADTLVASLVAQHGYGPSATPRIRYSALYMGLEQAAHAAKLHDLSVHMPRIGSGQAGGRWTVVEELVRDAFGQTRSPVTVYDLPLGSKLTNTANTQSNESAGLLVARPSGDPWEGE